MSLRASVVKGFVDSYLRSEERIVIRLLRTGRLEKEEWSEISGKLNTLAENYENGEISPQEFLEKRKELEEEIHHGRTEKNGGTTKEEAFELYEEYREQHEDVLVDAYIRSGRSTIVLLANIPVIKLRNFVAGIRYT